MTTVGELIEKQRDLATNRIGAEHDYRKQIKDAAESVASTRSRHIDLRAIATQTELAEKLTKIEQAEQNLDRALSILHEIEVDSSTETQVVEQLDAALIVLKETTNYY